MKVLRIMKKTWKRVKTMDQAEAATQRKYYHKVDKLRLSRLLEVCSVKTKIKHSS